MTKQKVTKILKILDELYPFDSTCFLDYQKPWQLLMATILSAQCTDARVNLVTADLFPKYPTLQDLANANYYELCEDIRSTGFFRTKAQHLIQSAELLLSNHNGELPSDIEALTILPGVGRKTANVVRGHIFGIPSITVDTHVKRISFKLGLTKHTDPEKIEFELMEVLPKPHWIAYNQQIITHGRQICTARSPKCGECPLASLCLEFKKSSTGLNKAT